MAKIMRGAEMEARDEWESMQRVLEGLVEYSSAGHCPQCGPSLIKYRRKLIRPSHPQTPCSISCADPRDYDPYTSEPYTCSVCGFSSTTSLVFIPGPQKYIFKSTEICGLGGVFLGAITGFIFRPSTEVKLVLLAALVGGVVGVLLSFLKTSD